MNLNLRPASECKFDAVSLGEVMLRLDPGEGRIRTARSFRAWEGGGEYNVVRGLRRCFGMNTGVRILPSPGSRRNITSPKDTASNLHSLAGLKFKSIFFLHFPIARSNCQISQIFTYLVSAYTHIISL